MSTNSGATGDDDETNDGGYQCHCWVDLRRNIWPNLNASRSHKKSVTSLCVWSCVPEQPSSPITRTQHQHMERLLETMNKNFLHLCRLKLAVEYLPLPLLSQTLVAAQGLESLELVRVKLGVTGVSQRVDPAWRDAVAQHASLRTIRLLWCQPIVEDVGDPQEIGPYHNGDVAATLAVNNHANHANTVIPGYYDLDEFVAAVARISNLKEVDLLDTRFTPRPRTRNATSTLSSWAGACLSALASNPSLQVLRLRNLSKEWSDRHLIALAQSLETNSTTTSLQQLHLDAPTFSLQAALAVTRTLETNTRLTSLSIELNNVFLDDNAVVLAKALSEHNHTSRSRLASVILTTTLHKQPERGITAQALQAWHNLVHTNYNLTNVVLQDGRGSAVTDDMEFQLFLNQIGRKGLFCSSTANRSTDAIPQRWINSVLQHADNLSVIFYLLSANPSLCLMMKVINGMTEPKIDEPQKRKRDKCEEINGTKRPKLHR